MLFVWTIGLPTIDFFYASSNTEIYEYRSLEFCVVYQGQWTKMDVCDQDSPTTAVVRLHNFGFVHFLSYS